MVDVSSKSTTFRTAEAVGVVELGREICDLIRDNLIKKGDVISVAQLAGIMAAKRTSELIPLCHQLQLSKVDVTIKIDSERHEAIVNCVAKCNGQTGVEMESLVGVSIACLTIYDMCKAVNKGIVVKNIRLLYKTGGKSDFISI